MQNLKVLLQEREKQIEQLDREHRQGQASWEREEKLVVSAWHELVRVGGGGSLMGEVGGVRLA